MMRLLFLRGYSRLLGWHGDQDDVTAREGGWGQGSHHSPAEALARPADPAPCHEGPLTETCQLFPYLKRDNVRLVMMTKAGKDHIRACKENKVNTFS